MSAEEHKSPIENVVSNNSAVLGSSTGGATRVAETIERESVPQVLNESRTGRSINTGGVDDTQARIAADYNGMAAFLSATRDTTSAPMVHSGIPGTMSPAVIGGIGIPGMMSAQHQSHFLSPGAADPDANLDGEAMRKKRGRPKKKPVTEADLAAAEAYENSNGLLTDGETADNNTVEEPDSPEDESGVRKSRRSRTPRKPDLIEQMQADELLKKKRRHNMNALNPPHQNLHAQHPQFQLMHGHHPSAFSSNAVGGQPMPTAPTGKRRGRRKKSEILADELNKESQYYKSMDLGEEDYDYEEVDGKRKRKILKSKSKSPECRFDVMYSEGEYVAVYASPDDDQNDNDLLITTSDKNSEDRVCFFLARIYDDVFRGIDKEEDVVIEWLEMEKLTNAATNVKAQDTLSAQTSSLLQQAQAQARMGNPFAANTLMEAQGLYGSAAAAAGLNNAYGQLLNSASGYGANAMQHTAAGGAGSENMMAAMMMMQQSQQSQNSLPDATAEDSQLNNGKKRERKLIKPASEDWFIHSSFVETIPYDAIICPLTDLIVFDSHRQNYNRFRLPANNEFLGRISKYMENEDPDEELEKEQLTSNMALRLKALINKNNISNDTNFDTNETLKKVYKNMIAQQELEDSESDGDDDTKKKRKRKRKNRRSPHGYGNSHHHHSAGPSQALLQAQQQAAHLQQQQRALKEHQQLMREQQEMRQAQQHLNLHHHQQQHSSQYGGSQGGFGGGSGMNGGGPPQSQMSMAAAAHHLHSSALHHNQMNSHHSQLSAHHQMAHSLHNQATSAQMQAAQLQALNNSIGHGGHGQSASQNQQQQAAAMQHLMNNLYN